MRYHTIDELDFSHIHGFWHWVGFIALIAISTLYFAVQLKMIDQKRQDRERRKKTDRGTGEKP